MAVVSIGIFFRLFLLSVLFDFFYRESVNLYKDSQRKQEFSETTRSSTFRKRMKVVPNDTWINFCCFKLVLSYQRNWCWKIHYISYIYLWLKSIYFINKKTEIQLKLEDYSCFSPDPTPVHELATRSGLSAFKESP